MAKQKRVYAGTDDIEGAICTKADYDEFFFEKEGVKYVLVKEEEFQPCYCESSCYCSSSLTYFRCYKIVE